MVDHGFSCGENGNPITYKSKMLVHGEKLSDGILRGTYFSATGQITGWQPWNSAQAFELEIDGRDMSGGWSFVKSYERKSNKYGVAEAVVELSHSDRRTTLRVVTKLDGSQIIARYLEITNTSDEPRAISHIAPWCGIVWNNSVSYGPVRGEMVATDPEGEITEKYKPQFSVCFMDDDKHGSEGDLGWRALESGIFRLERDRSQCNASPYWIVRNELTGELAFFALAWSGRHYAEFIRRDDSVPGQYSLTDYNSNCFAFRCGLLGKAPLRVIAPGETVRSPELHFGVFHTSLDRAVEGWYEHVRRSVIPRRPEGKKAYVSAGRVVEVDGDWILNQVDIAADMGVEAFMVDAGWYGDNFAAWPVNRGDWNEGSWLPLGGLAGIRDYVRSRGMLFGLWHECENISEDSRVRREHPEWVLKNYAGGFTNSINLANPQAREHFRNSVFNITERLDVDYYKIDNGVGFGSNEILGYSEDSTWRHNEALYGVFDEVLEKCPSVALENCAGGGGRNDLGIMSRFHYACESDWSYFPNNIRAINSMTMFLPPESICYYHNHIAFAHLTGELETNLRVTLFCTPVFVAFGDIKKAEEAIHYPILRKYIDLYKNFCSDVLASDPIVYHHTPAIGLFRPADFCVLEYSKPDKTRGYAGIFKLSRKNQNRDGCEYIFKPRGVDISHDYEVTFDGFGGTVRLTGGELLRGIPIRLDSALTSELVLNKMIR